MVVLALALALPSASAITSAFLLKLTTSLDDLLWLSPFLSLSPSVSNKLKHSVVYFFVCIIVTMVAFVFGTSLLALTSSGSEDGSHGRGYWNPERFLSIFSASVLFYIARNDYVEWKEVNHKNSHTHKNTTSYKSGRQQQQSRNRTAAVAMGNTTTASSQTTETQLELELQLPTITNTHNDKGHQLRSRSYASRQSLRHSDDPEAGASGSGDDYNSSNNGDNDSDSDNGNGNASGDDDSDDEEIRTKIEEASKSLRRFVTVCVMGTLDDMIVFSAFVAGGAGAEKKGGNSDGNSNSNISIDGYFALFIGTTFAALLIVAISWFFSEIECFKRIIKKIPMWALLTGIGVYILIMGLI